MSIFGEMKLQTKNTMKNLSIMKQVVLAFIVGMSMTIVSCSKDGDPGSEGPQGIQGEAGLDGLNGVDGTDGADGADGKDAPNKSFYFQQGFKDYMEAEDNYISPNFPNNNHGMLSYLQVRHDASVDPQAYVYSLVRFDNIDTTILPYLDDTETEGTADDFYINEAVLYLYCYSGYSTFNSNVKLELDFYDSTDPLFDETKSTWEAANEVEGWAAGSGGESNNEWDSLYATGYQVSLPHVDESKEDMGWIAVPLPRTVVKYWITDADNANKGFRIKLLGDDSESALSYLYLRSSQYGVEDLRPLLFINGEPAETNEGGRMKRLSWKQQLAEWEMKSYNEQMAPLDRFLLSKND